MKSIKSAVFGRIFLEFLKKFYILITHEIIIGGNMTTIIPAKQRHFDIFLELPTGKYRQIGRGLLSRNIPKNIHNPDFQKDVSIKVLSAVRKYQRLTGKQYISEWQPKITFCLFPENMVIIQNVKTRFYFREN